jgi:hypothetical protein
VLVLVVGGRREGVVWEAREESAIFAGVGGMVVSFHCL